MRRSLSDAIQPGFWSTTAVAICLGVAWQAAVRAEEQAGQIYADKCAHCHGENGEGVADGYDQPLAGELSLEELTELVINTMPEEDPEQCVGEEARDVTQFIFEKFYVPSKQAKRQVELTRLTVPQYRNAVADLLETFSPREVESDDESHPKKAEGNATSEQESLSNDEPLPGMLGRYYQSKGMSKANELVIRRVDRQIDFDFKDGSPGPGITADQFAMIWEGSLLASHTGYYEFRLTTQNGARLYFNLDPQAALRKLRDDSSAAGQQALIDAWVGSGEKRQRSERIFLLGGRRYPFRVEFFKYKEPTASLRFEWKPPHGSWSVLSAADTTTASSPRVYVCETPFPADDRSLGYERGSSVSPEWQTAVTNAAIETATEVVNRLPVLAGLPDDVTKRRACVQEFLLRFAERAYRRQLTDLERTDLISAAFNDAGSLETAVRRGVLMTLMSPHFLYTDLTPAKATPAPHVVATQLALAMWDSLPDRQLLRAAQAGELQTPEQIEAQAQRMLQDQRTKAKVDRFFEVWLELEGRDLAKDKRKFPDFDEAVIADLRHSLDLFVDQVVWSRASDYRELLLADYLLLNDRLKSLYHDQTDGDQADGDQADGDQTDGDQANGDQKGVEHPEGITQAEPQQSSSVAATKDDESTSSLAGFEPVKSPAGLRSGVLTHPYLLSAFAYHNNTSPIHRGVFLTRNIVGRQLNPPPMAIAFEDSQFSPDLTMREKVTALTRDKACMSCHAIINPLGFALESFDAVGRWRESENDKPIDTMSEYTTAAGEHLDISSARDVAEYAVSNPTAHRAFVTHLFEHVVKQNPSYFGSGVIERLTSEFVDDEFNIQKLWARAAATAATHYAQRTSDDVASIQSKLSRKPIDSPQR